MPVAVIEGQLSWWRWSWRRAPSIAPAWSFRTSPLSESRLLWITSCHHSVVGIALLLLLLRRCVEAVSLLIVGVEIVLLVDAHVLMNELMRCGCHWGRRLHHLILAGALIHVHAACAHDLTARSTKRRGYRRRLLVNEALGTLEPVVLISRVHQEALVLFVGVRRLVFTFHTRLVRRRFNWLWTRKARLKMRKMKSVELIS